MEIKSKSQFKDSYRKWLTTREYIENLKPEIERYMKENSIPRVEIDEKETLVLEPIPNRERALWIKLWLNEELAASQLLKEIIRYREYHFQWASWDTRDFLRAIKEETKFDLG